MSLASRTRAVLIRVSIAVALGLCLLVLLDAIKRRVAPAGGVDVTPDVEYGRTGYSTLRLDVYRPRARATSPRPAVLVIHGGGWVEGDKSGEAGLATHLAAVGFVAFAVNYRLAVVPENHYPAAALDVRRAVRWVRAHAAEYGVDPGRVGAVGQSAGGHLVALLGTTDDPDPADPNSGRFSSRVACVVDDYGPTDFTDDANPPVGPSIAQVIPMFFGRPRDEIPDAYRAASPALRVDALAAPTLIFHGTADEIVPIEQSRRFERALRAAGVEARLVEFPGVGHGIADPEVIRPWIATMTAFLVDHLKP